ncbi:PQQ-binding-like beta-propeller repeat protein [Cellulophaga tyrosinoxydans]|uniref:PQQ-like domain-containing protein n=1 Tax=Cellulophaga tyrosinoxydans TaxID=504486 RepID=A0A1W1YSK7_9FLAO|nr:PQQ-binding-like beta-propeller repeat protein [Cellulophaga tyrosinoxydans]SMC39092.1 hypothetical protein SAMN05660703_0834 [Cellulophaga tyrosinoxydans]
MFKSAGIKKGIEEFKIITDKLFYKKNENHYHLYADKLIVDRENYGFFSFDDYFGLNHKDSTDIINLVSGSKTTIPTTFFGMGYYDNNFITSKNSIREGAGLYSSNYLICQLFPFKELYELPHRYYGSGDRFKNQYIQIQNERKYIKSLSLLTGKYEWETNLENFGEIRKILGVVENKLWVSLYRAGNEKNETRLLALDIESGKVIFELDHQYPISDWFIELLEEDNSLLSIYSGIGTQALDSPLVEIDAITGKVLRSQRIESLYNQNLKIGFWKVLENKIYFTANQDYLSGTHIGVLDYNTLELLWVTKVENQKGGFKDFQVNHNNIYVLDQGNQLHIFEKTEKI